MERVPKPARRTPGTGRCAGDFERLRAMITYQWTSAVIALVIAGVIVWLVRHNHLQARNAGWWIVIAIVVAVGGAFPTIVDWIAVRLGIHYPPTLAFSIGIAVVLIKMLKMDVERSKERRRVRILAQKIAVLEAKLQPRDEDTPVDGPPDPDE